MDVTISNLTADGAELMSLLRRGHGRAVLFLRGKEPSQFREIVVHACVHNLAYDQQMESRRSQYLFDVIQATGEPGFYASFIRDALQTSINDNDLYQLVGLVLILAKHGDQEARTAIYEFAEKQPLYQGDFLGAEELIELDGLEGFVWVVHHLPEPPDDYFHWHPSRYPESLEEAIGKEAAEIALIDLAQTDPMVAQFVEKAEAYRKEHRGGGRPPYFDLPDYETLLELLGSTNKRPHPTRWAKWGREAGKRFVKKVARLLENESDPLRLLRLVSFFDEREFPGDAGVILNLVQSKDEKIARAARHALKNISDPRVRELAIELILFSRDPGDGVDMLSSNYQEGDDQLIVLGLSRDLSPEDFHGLNLSIRSYQKTYPWMTNKDLLMIIYERVHCSSCRGYSVGFLQELGPLPDWMIEECRYDANLDLRRLVGA